MKRLYFLLITCTVSFYTVAQPAGTVAPPGFAGSTPTLIKNGGVQNNCFGTDVASPQYSAKVQLFDFDGSAGSFNIVGAVFWLGYLKVNGTPGSVNVGVYDYCGWIGMTWASKQAGFTVPNQDCPYDIIGGYATVTTDKLVQSTCLDDASVVIFDSPVTMSSSVTCSDKYGIGIDFNNIGDDEFGLYSTNFNEGGLYPNYNYKEYSWEYDHTFTADGAWFTILANTNGVIHADMMIFPIIDQTAFNASPATGVCADNVINSIEETSYYKGMKLSQSYPNPTANSCSIDYEIENDAVVTLRVMDMTGKEVAFFEEGTKKAGKYSINFDVSNLQSGNYVYMLNAGGEVMAKQMMLNK